MLDQDGGMWNAVEGILSNLVDSVDPQRADALYYAAVPQWFSAELYTALNPQEAEKFLSWLTQFSFITVLSSSKTDFMVQPMERAILNEIFIGRAPELYREAHGRTLDYWLDYPHSDPVVQAQNVLYHRILVDQAAARQELIDLFEYYVDNRQLGAMEQLLKSANEAIGYLAQLNQPSHSLQELLLYMSARQAQLQGGWAESKEILDSLEIEAEPGLQPFVTRAAGFLLEDRRDYAGAIEQFQLAAEQFAQNADILGEKRSQVERADTLVALGDAYIDLAEATISLDERRRRLESNWRFLQGVYYLFLSLPLAAYMTRAVGLRAWMPHLWSMWRDVDWIKADLYSQATSRFREADRLLSEIDRPDKDLIAEEKLADLYLSVGDAVEARTLYVRLLASTELSDYRRSRIQVGFGQTQWLLGDEEAAEQALTGALPSLRYYVDKDREAEAETVLGSIAAQSEDPQAALGHFQRALDIYLIGDNSDLVAATNVAEQLDLVAEHPALTPEAREAAKDDASRVAERRYPVQQRYGVTRFFQQLFLFSVIVLGGIGLLNVISIERTTVAPNIVFHASPLLDATKGEPVLILGTTTYAISDKSEIVLGDGILAELQVGQGINSLVIENPELRFVLAGLVVALAGYLVAVTVIGILVLWRIDPQEVQDTHESSTVRLADEELSVGEEGVQRSISFDEISRYVISNTRLFRRPISDSYLLLENSSGEQVIVNGATAHYERVQQHIEERLSQTAERSDLSHSLLISLAGVLLLVTVLLYLLIVIFSRIGEQSIHAPIAGSSYSGVTLFPYLLLGFLLPVLWWFVWKPLQRRHKLGEFDWTPFLLILVGLLIILSITIVTGLGHRVRLSTPDLYPVLVAVGLLVAGVIALTFSALKRRRSDGDSSSAQSLVVTAGEVELEDDLAAESGMSLLKRIEIRAQALPDAYRIILLISLYILLLVVAGLTIFYLSTEISAYHYWVQGEKILKDGNKQKIDGEPGWEELLVDAHDNYTEAIRIAEGSAWKVFDDDSLADIYTSRAHASLILGIEDLSLGSESANMETADFAHYKAAVAGYEKAIELAPDSPQGYLWLGFAHHTAGDKNNARENYARAIFFGGVTEEELLSWESGTSCPQYDGGGIDLKPEHIVKAFTGLGWIYFSEKDYEKAQVNFLIASAYADCLAPEFVQEKSEAALGLGYTYYKDRRFDEAENIWLQAAQRDSHNAALLTSLGTVYWRMGTLGQDYTASGSDRCTQDALGDEEKTRVAALLENSIDYLTRSAEVDGQLPVDRAYTYRTRGQVQYLLRNCPGYEKYQVFQDAVDSYSKAIESNREEPQYHFMRSRLLYAQWGVTSASGPAAREPVVRAMVDITEALRLFDRTCPAADYEPCRWYSAIKNGAVDGVLARGDGAFNQGDFENAIGYYSLLTRYVPDLEEIYLAHLSLGRVALAQGNDAEAIEWYEQGIAGAEDAEDRVSIIEAWDDLLALHEKDPQVDLRPVQVIFDSLDFDYDVSAAFSCGVESLRAADVEKARDAFERGIGAALEIGDFDLIKKNFIVVLNEMPGDGREAVLQMFGEWLPRIERAAASDLAIEEAFDLGFMAWALGEAELAARWYQEGIRRTAEFSANNSNDAVIYREGLKASRDDLFAYWQSGAAVDAHDLTAVMDAYRSNQLEEYPSLEEHGLYWRYQGWFKYHVALKAFLAGDADVAAAVLESGKQDAEVAFPLDEDDNRFVFEYLHQGAWSWYFIERAMELQDAGDFAAAYADYVTAMEAYPEEVTDNTVRNEMVDTALDAGFMAFKLGDNEQALQWYETAVEHAKSFAKEERLQKAREALQAEEVEGATAAELQREILGLLDSD